MRPSSKSTRKINPDREGNVGLSQLRSAAKARFDLFMFLYNLPRCHPTPTDQIMHYSSAVKYQIFLSCIYLKLIFIMLLCRYKRAASVWAEKLSPGRKVVQERIIYCSLVFMSKKFVSAV